MPTDEKLKFSPDTYKKLLLAQSYQDSIKFLAKDLISEKKIFKDIFFADRNPIKLANEVREYLQAPIESQIKLRDTEAAFKYWRRKIESVGVFTFKDTFKDRFISGFCLLDEEYPIIFINNTTAFSKQIFTLIHELGHILYGINGIILVDDSYIDEMNINDRKLEIYCNEFAGNFLVPVKEFSQDIEYYIKSGPESISKIANKYSVSREVILRRLYDNQIIDRIYYETKAKEWIEEYLGRSVKSSGGNYYLTKLAYLGQGYTNLVYENLKRGRITEIEASEHLQMKARNLDKLQHQLDK